MVTKKKERNSKGNIKQLKKWAKEAERQKVLAKKLACDLCGHHHWPCPQCERVLFSIFGYG